MAIFYHLDDKFDFGKYKGCTLGEVLMDNPEYIEWVNFNVKGNLCVITDSAMLEIRRMFPMLTFTSYFEKCRQSNMETLECDSGNDYMDDEYVGFGEEPTYERYSGSYAQDVMGYSDDDIDTIFDGDPLAYWNID